MSLSGCFYPECLAVILVYTFSSGGERPLIPASHTTHYADPGSVTAAGWLKVLEPLVFHRSVDPGTCSDSQFIYHETCHITVGEEKL